MNLTGTAVTDLTLAKILQETNELTELHLAGIRISDKSLSHIIALPKLKYIFVPPENDNGFSRSSALAIMGNCATLRAILQESEAKLEMKIFNPPSFFVWR